MSSQINNKLGIGSGLTLSEIAAAVVGAMPKVETIQPGQVVQFKEGQVPEGYAQISGPAVSPTVAGYFGAENLKAKTGVDYARFASTAGRLFATAPSGSTVVIQELDASLTPIAGAVATIPGLASGYNGPALVPTPDGQLLRIGGTTTTYLGTSVSKYNPVTKAWTNLATRTTDVHSQAWLGAFSSDGCLYMHGANGGAAIDKFDLSANQWTYGFDTGPLSTAPLGIAKLPSGKLFVAYTSAQYVFNPQAAAGSRWVQVGSITLPTQSSGPVATWSGVRFYDFARTVNGVGGCVSFHDYVEETGVITTTNTSFSYSASGAYTQNALTNPMTGAVLLKSTSSSHMHIHYLPYTPAATVSAVKL